MMQLELFLVGYVLVRPDYATYNHHNLWCHLSSLFRLRQVCWRSGNPAGQLSLLWPSSDPNCFHPVALPSQHEASSESMGLTISLLMLWPGCGTRHFCSQPLDQNKWPRLTGKCSLLGSGKEKGNKYWCK